MNTVVVEMKASKSIEVELSEGKDFGELKLEAEKHYRAYAGFRDSIQLLVELMESPDDIFADMETAFQDHMTDIFDAEDEDDGEECECAGDVCDFPCGDPSFEFGANVHTRRAESLDRWACPEHASRRNSTASRQSYSRIMVSSTGDHAYQAFARSYVFSPGVLAFWINAESPNPLNYTFAGAWSSEPGPIRFTRIDNSPQFESLHHGNPCHNTQPHRSTEH